VAAGRGELFVAQGAAALRRQVQTGVAAGDHVEVVAGLSAGERVVVRGAFNLKDGDLVRVEQPSPSTAVAKGGK